MREYGRSSPLRLQFGLAVKKQRTAIGITQEELAERAELHRTYITDIERGTRNPTLETMWNIALALGTNLPTLLSFHKTGSASSDPDLKN
ncbi:MAG TPA: helix-turn-helix transcriptional regulator [Bacteroidota bacterium]|nr:helix-turn-helix transcriptional regulator [Bacteroidota bacterium]